MKKILYFDTETTGVDPVKNDIIQIAGIIEVDGEVKEEFNLKAKPFDFTTIQDRALEVNNVTREELEEYPDPRQAYVKLLGIFTSHIDKFDREDKFFPAGQNIRFDLDFLSNFFRKNYDKYFGSWQNWKMIDSLYITNMLASLGLLNLPNHKLETVCEHFEIKIEKAHDALSDIRATRELIMMYRERICRNWIKSEAR